MKIMQIRVIKFDLFQGHFYFLHFSVYPFQRHVFFISWALGLSIHMTGASAIAPCQVAT